MQSGVYMIFNFANGKFYIGSSRDVEARLAAHLRDLRKGLRLCRNGFADRFQNDWNKYGKEKFGFTYLEYCESYLEREQYYLDLLQPWKREIGYNTSKYATAPMKDRKHALKSIAKMCVVKQGKNNGMFGRRHSNETKAKQSVSTKKRFEDLDERKKLSAAMSGENSLLYGISQSLEHRQKIGLALKNKPKSKEHCANLSKTLSDGRMAGKNNSMFGTHMSNETKVKISCSLKEYNKRKKKELQN